MPRRATRFLFSSFLLASIAWGPYGLGALMTAAQPGACASCDDCEDDDEGAGVDERTSFPCPPICRHCLGCDDCSGCTIAIAVPTPLTIDAISLASVVHRFDVVSSAPAGERAGVFRPPRA